MGKAHVEGKLSNIHSYLWKLEYPKDEQIFSSLGFSFLILDIVAECLKK